MFIVFEIQTNTNGTVGTITSTYDNQNQAESAYHSILSSAAISNLPKHACVILTEEGDLLQSECYKHNQSISLEE